MRSFRSSILGQPFFVTLLLAMALCVKALIPAGYMISADSKTFTVGICSDGMGAAKTITMTVPMESGKSGAPADKGATDSPCAFSVLSTAMIGGANAPLLALALLFILALGFLPPSALLRVGAVRLRPPSHGPPSQA